MFFYNLLWFPMSSYDCLWVLHDFLICLMISFELCMISFDFIWFHWISSEFCMISSHFIWFLWFFVSSAWFPMISYDFLWFPLISCEFSMIPYDFLWFAVSSACFPMIPYDFLCCMSSYDVHICSMIFNVLYWLSMIFIDFQLFSSSSSASSSLSWVARLARPLLDLCSTFSYDFLWGCTISYNLSWFPMSWWFPMSSAWFFSDFRMISFEFCTIPCNLLWFPMSWKISYEFCMISSDFIWLHSISCEFSIISYHFLWFVVKSAWFHIISYELKDFLWVMHDFFWFHMTSFDFLQSHTALHSCCKTLRACARSLRTLLLPLLPTLSLRPFAKSQKVPAGWCWALLANSGFCILVRPRRQRTSHIDN